MPNETGSGGDEGERTDEIGRRADQLSADQTAKEFDLTNEIPTVKELDLTNELPTVISLLNDSPKLVEYKDLPTVKDYDTDIETHKMGKEIARILVYTFAISYVICFGTLGSVVWFSKDPLEAFLKGIPILMTPLFGTISTVLGFYFGSKAK